MVLSPSRSSTASCSPVDAPLGTMARALAPPSRNTSASTVGLPRESSTWRPRMSAILVRAISAFLFFWNRLEINRKDTAARALLHILHAKQNYIGHAKTLDRVLRAFHPVLIPNST